MAEIAIQQKSFLSGRVAHFTESVIREMTRQAMLHDAVNLSQGFPDFPAPTEIKCAAQEAIAADVNQYGLLRFNRDHDLHLAGGLQCRRRSGDL
jgi:aspartate/methionine/tyrosine aminotransferase